MRITSKLLNFGEKTIVSKFANSHGVVSTAEALAGKVNFVGFHPEKLLSSPAADQFIRSAGKQNATILSDNIVGLGYNQPGRVFRVITKRFPSGTTVANMFGIGGEPYGREIITKTSVARSADWTREKCCSFVDHAKGIAIVKPHMAPTSRIYGVPYVDVPFLNEIKGITEISNAGNKNYQALKDMKLVYGG